MFNPTSLDEFCVQSTHLEERGKQNIDENEEMSLEVNGRKRGMQIS